LVPSRRHEVLVGLFRNRAMLARELLSAFPELNLEDAASAESASVDLSHAVSTEYRADNVTLLRDHRGAPVLAVVVEVQLQIDARKARSWPVYLTTARAHLDCPVVLLVLAPNARVAKWARKAIPIGHPGFSLQPLVISETDVPRILDPERAQRSPHLAVLSAMSHRSLEVAEVAISSLLGLPEDESRLYFDAILEALPRSLLSTLEDRLSYEYQSAFARKYVSMGQRSAVLELAREKLGGLSVHDEAAISAIGESARLTELLLGLGRATSVEQARAALRAATERGARR
jgi:hypothetical protein